ncbi:hypothetical protein [Metabacillus arenae]|uniref:Uncharacterized protein n=1 Tax=Metabacillus arenae TaxID=2771434 RepID=A0A926RUZ4_9BACI|nr:hypothetical protein [Metabacillus arenae]MBD1379113.1 hypothetical protein [Metabacillus arenae]
MKRYFTGIAQETLGNNSICVKEGEYIRKIIDDEDIERELLVYINNIGEVTINPNRPVRYTVLNVSFR